MIYIPKICGACKGVNNYLNKIYEREINNNSKRVVIFNDNLNNSLIKEEISNLGIEYVDNIKKLSTNDIVILPYHGIKLEDKEYLDKHNIEYYDTTCKLYLELMNKAIDKYKNGYEIYIVGNKDTKEVNNILSYINYDGIILESIVDVVNLRISDKLKYITCIPSVSDNQYKEISNALREKDNNTLFIESKTCNCSNNILNSSLGSNCKFNFIVKDSYLYEEIKKDKKAYHISNIKEFIKLVMSLDISLEDDILITGGINTSLKELLNYKYLLSFMLFYKTICIDIEHSEANINSKLLNAEDNDEVKKFMQDFVSLNTGGKHIRGVLIALGYFLAKGSIDNNYLDLATSYELFETSILIHDDIIDNAKMRRGKETIPRKICHRYMEKIMDKQSVLVLANSIAICAGDIGFYLSNQIIYDSYKNYECFAKLLECFNNIVINTIKGEVLDVSLPFKERNNLKSSNLDDIITIYKLKTSLYTILGPVTLGYILGNKEIPSILKEILTDIGISYQIKDDINGIFNKSLDKTTSDIQEFKQTILYNYVIDTDYKDEFLKIYGKKNIKEKDLLEIQNILIESGTLEKVLEYLNNLTYEINEKLDKCDILDIGKDIIRGLCIYINNL